MIRVAQVWLGVMDKQVLELSDAIDIERVLEHERTPEARAARKNYLRHVSKQIDRLWVLVRSSDSPNMAMFNALTSEVIGRYLSNRSFEQLRDPTSSPEPSDRDSGFRPPRVLVVLKLDLLGDVAKRALGRK